MKSVKKVLSQKGMLQETTEYEDGKSKNRNPKVIVNGEKEKRYVEIIITE